MITLQILSLVIGAIVALIKRNTVEDGSLFAVFLLPFMITNVIIAVNVRYSRSGAPIKCSHTGKIY